MGFGAVSPSLGASAGSSAAASSSSSSGTYLLISLVVFNLIGKLMNSEYFFINSFKVFSSANSSESYFNCIVILVPLIRGVPSASLRKVKELAAEDVQTYYSSSLCLEVTVTTYPTKKLE